LPITFHDLLGPSKSVSSSVLVKPNEPVSAIRREQHRLGLADVRGAGGEQLLGHADVGTPVEQLGGKSRGNGRRDLLLLDRAPARDRAGVAAQQHAQLVLLERGKALQVGKHGLDAVQLGLALPVVHLAGDSALEAVLGELDRLPARLDRAPRDLEPSVEVAHLEVGARHVRDERQDGGAARLLRAEEERLLRLGGPADAPEEVDLPRDVGRERVDRRLGGLGRRGRVALGRVDQAAGVEAQAGRPWRSR
jgi:hypothetical protein